LRVNEIVVTGAAGFVGATLVDRLRAAGRPVVPVSRRMLPGVTQVDDYAKAPGGAVVIHLAEESDRAHVNGLGEAYADRAAEVVRQLARRAGHLIYASSGVVYGDACERPFTTDQTALATDTYSRAKIRNEQIALSAGATVLRFSNLCGAGMSSKNVLSDILRQIPGSAALRLRDDSPVRDFLCVTDAAAAVAASADVRPGGVLNVGSGVGLSIRELARMALRAAGEPQREIVAVERSPRRSVNILDIALTRQRLGWTPRSTLRELLARLIQAGVRP
jgi:UDP-glucose 4-epimerase